MCLWRDVTRWLCRLWEKRLKVCIWSGKIWVSPEHVQVTFIKIRTRQIKSCLLLNPCWIHQKFLIVLDKCHWFEARLSKESEQCSTSQTQKIWIGVKYKGSGEFWWSTEASRQTLRKWAEASEKVLQNLDLCLCFKTIVPLILYDVFIWVYLLQLWETVKLNQKIRIYFQTRKRNHWTSRNVS